VERHELRKYRRLINLLIKRTEAGTANWEPTSRDDMFAVSFPEFSVRVSQQRSNSAIDVVFEIVNSSGTVIDRFTDTEIGEGFGSSLDQREFYKSAANLYDGARRHALGVDEALDSLIAELDKDV
jgi:hypothetical protein